MSVIELSLGPGVTPKHCSDQLDFIHTDVSSSNRFLSHLGDNLSRDRVARTMTPNAIAAEVHGATPINAWMAMT